MLIFSLSFLLLLQGHSDLQLHRHLEVVASEVEVALEQLLPLSRRLGDLVVVHLVSLVLQEVVALVLLLVQGHLTLPLQLVVPLAPLSQVVLLVLVLLGNNNNRRLEALALVHLDSSSNSQLLEVSALLGNNSQQLEALVRQPAASARPQVRRQEELELETHPLRPRRCRRRCRLMAAQPLSGIILCQ